MTKNSHPNKYGYNGYGIGFGSRSQFSLPNGEWCKNVIFGVDNSSSVHANNRKNILVLGNGPTNGLEDTAITAEIKYSINKSIKYIC